MLIRVAGKLKDGRPFSTRVDADSAIEAVTKTGEKLTKAGQLLDGVTSINAAPVQESEDIYLGDAKTPEQIAAAKEKRANKKAEKAKAAAAATPEAPAGKKGK